jgi:Ser/Thr protein kinase RdoA (MazF antagonist)
MVSSEQNTPPDQPLEYANLQPSLVLDAVESVGIKCTGSLFALNSYENRVYRLGTEDGSTVIAKFYRPGRWSDDAIDEELTFLIELSDAEIPAVPPLLFADKALHYYEGFRFALFPTVGGRAPELDNEVHLAQVGRLMGRLHALAKTRKFEHRPVLSVQRFGVDSVDYLCADDVIPLELMDSYQAVARAVVEQAGMYFERLQGLNQQRLHGDCHIGNILWMDGVATLVDFDDCVAGPAVQDLWMFLSGDEAYMNVALSHVLRGYVEFCDFDTRELTLIEPLRALRMVHYAAWLSKRREEPAFQIAFPWFNDRRYWDEHILSLREQLAVLQEPPNLEFDPRG